MSICEERPVYACVCWSGVEVAVKQNNLAMRLAKT